MESVGGIINIIRGNGECGRYNQYNVEKWRVWEV